MSPHTSTRLRLALVLVALGVYVLGGIAALGFGLWSGLSGSDRTTVGDALRSQAGFLVVAGLLHAVVLGVAVSFYFGRYVTGARRAAAEARLVAVANPAHRLGSFGPPEIRDLAAAVDLLADHVRGSVTEHERDRLAGLVSRLPFGVIGCDGHGLIQLYNEGARRLVGDRELLGLGRSVFAIVDRAAVATALAGDAATSDGLRVTATPDEDGFVLLVEPSAPAERVVGAAASDAAAASVVAPLSFDFRVRPASPGQRLDELACTVLDTETTGMNPAGGDAIVSIAGVRVINGRLLPHESFDELVDPGRAVPATSTAVHGISTEMLAGRPAIEAVLPSFAAFAADTVLVGHNIGFDLAFLRRVEQRAGVRFEHPVLDTLLLSTVVHPDATEHSLDAVAARLGVDVLGRHTALGDALVTAEVFVRLLRLLSAQGVTTLEQATALTQRTAQARANSYDRDTTAGAPDPRNLPAM